MQNESLNRKDLVYARNPRMAIEDASKVKRPEIEIGDYSTQEGEREDIPDLPMYSGQTVVVIDRCRDWDAETDWGKGEGLERGFKVRADDGTEFEAYEGELSGWYYDTGQYFISASK